MKKESKKKFYKSIIWILLSLLFVFLLSTFSSLYKYPFWLGFLSGSIAGILTEYIDIKFIN